MQLSGETVAWLSVSDSYAEHEPPAWAPDGGRLAFLYRPIWRLGGPSPIEWEEIYTANADGTRGRPISTAWSYLDLLSMRSPAWSPGGEFLVFASDMLDGQLRVYLLDAELAIQLAN
jgi:Tol biopolymer transport system component